MTRVAARSAGALVARRAGTRILAIDPGPVRSAWLFLENDRPASFSIYENDVLLECLRRPAGFGATFRGSVDVVVIEQIESFGMAVGREVFETVHWSGRFTEAAHPATVVQLPRRTVKLHLCKSARAKDSNIRAALIDRFGGSSAIGRKSAPGPLLGIANDVWSALAIAVTYADGAA